MFYVMQQAIFSSTNINRQFVWTFFLMKLKPYIILGEGEEQILHIKRSLTI